MPVLVGKGAFVAIGAAFVLATAAYGLVVARKVSATEARIREFCAALAPGREMEAARAAARAEGFLVKDYPADQWRGPLVVIEVPPGLWPVSVCTLRHDGRLIQSASFDAWYE